MDTTKWSCVQQKSKQFKHNKPTDLKCLKSVKCTKVSQFEITKTPNEHIEKKIGNKTQKILEKTERMTSDCTFSNI